MCTGLHLRAPARIGEWRLSPSFLIACRLLPQWLSSCISCTARLLPGAEIGVPIVKLDAGNNRRTSERAARATAQDKAQIFAPSSSGRALPGLLWSVVVAGGGTGSNHFFAACTDHVLVHRQHRTQRSKRQTLSKATCRRPGPGSGKCSLPGTGSIDPGSVNPERPGRQRSEQPRRQTPEAGPSQTAHRT
jgi:hypothetical protein